MATVWGLTRRQVYALDLESPLRGVRTVQPAESLHARCAAASLVLECHAFSHVTAARLHGLPLPRALDDDRRLHVMRDARDGAVRRENVVGHRGLLERDVVGLHGLAVVGLADTWVDFGELIRPGVPFGLDDLVVLGDAVATTLGSADPLHEALAARVRPRGKLTLLEALEWIRVGSESAGETRTRLVLSRAGLPEPELNVPIFSSTGRWLGRPDMRWPEQRVLLEYQGREFHDSEDQRALDAVRFAGFEEDCWTVVATWNDDVNSDEARSRLVLRMADLLDRPVESLHLSEIHPRFFSTRMLQLAELRARRLRQHGG
ncbi:hypothetical protein [Intrasporangium calvum]|uniref:hypothetical protein n=1 Tax=Intrasporangium calvum TaxID=53358 RepID=UPI001F1BAAC0|nr:hypothetical protein [Intrasporangium calvum]